MFPISQQASNGEPLVAFVIKTDHEIKKKLYEDLSSQQLCSLFQSPKKAKKIRQPNSNDASNALNIKDQLFGKLMIFKTK